MGAWIYQIQDGDGNIYYEGTHEECLNTLKSYTIKTMDQYKIKMIAKEW